MKYYCIQKDNKFQFCRKNRVYIFFESQKAETKFQSRLLFNLHPLFLFLEGIGVFLSFHLDANLTHNTNLSRPTFMRCLVFGLLGTILCRLTSLKSFLSSLVNMSCNNALFGLWKRTIILNRHFRRKPGALRNTRKSFLNALGTLLCED